MRTVFVVALASCMAWAVGEYAAVDISAPPIATPGYLLSTELSRDNGNMVSAWVYYNGAGAYAGDQYDTPSATPWLVAIKYFVWSQGWPDSAYQGFEVACWKMTGGTPGDVVWPTDGIPIYNPNIGGNWITHECDETINLTFCAPNGFLVGIGFLYTYPYMDGFGVDNTGVGPYDWAYTGSTWAAAPYGVQSARAIVENIWWDVEPNTLGNIRALYH